MFLFEGLLHLVKTVTTSECLLTENGWTTQTETPIAEVNASSRYGSSTKASATFVFFESPHSRVVDFVDTLYKYLTFYFLL